MLRRLVGAWLVMLLIGAAGWNGNPDALKDSLTLHFEASYVSLDPWRIPGNTSRRTITPIGQPNEKVVPKLMLGPFRRVVRSIQPNGFSREPSIFESTHQNKFPVSRSLAYLATFPLQ